LVAELSRYSVGTISTSFTKHAALRDPDGSATPSKSANACVPTSTRTGHA
jgi:hypothetical protein